MNNSYKSKTIKDEMTIWKASEAKKQAAATIRFNNIAKRKAKANARNAKANGNDQDAAQQMRLF